MITLGLAALLATGLIAAKLCQWLRLPSVTGYIIAGMLLGPTGFALITEESVGHSLDHFTHIALMLIAFGIGEHVELKKLKKHAKSLLWIGACETTGAFLLVSAAIFFIITISGFHIEGWQLKDQLALSILLGAVSIATAPAATLLVVRELQAKGPLTSTLLAIVAIDNGLAIMIFGLVVSVAHQILGQTGSSLLGVIGNGLFEIVMSLTLGSITGLCLDLVIRKLKSEEEMLTAGLAILLLCSELAIFMHLSPLLAGIMAGFTLVNKAERDVRVFRALNSFEPPIYILFFTLAGTHLNFGVLGSAWLLGVVYFAARVVGKFFGVRLGAKIAHSPFIVRKLLGLTLVPQAGVAIGLIFLIGADQTLSPYSSIITPVVLTGVFLSELIGPLSSSYAIKRAGEAVVEKNNVGHLGVCEGLSEKECDQLMRSARGVKILPWTWEKLHPHPDPQDVVVFGATRRQTVNGIARIATIFAHHYKASPMAVFVQPPGEPPPDHNFEIERNEVDSMGYELTIEVVPDKNITSGIVAAVEYDNARAVVLSYPLHDEDSNFPQILETVASNVSCPVIVVQFYGVLHTEKILVPVTDMYDLAEVYPIVAALAEVGEHQIHLLSMLSSDADQDAVETNTEQIYQWLDLQPDRVNISVKSVPTDARVQTIKDEAENHDIVVMGAIRTRGVRKFFFGSLADTLSQELKKPLIVVYDANKGKKQ